MRRRGVPAFGFLLLFVSVSCVLHAGTVHKTFPRTILLIRHAEKPPEGDPSVDLSAPGHMRAKALHKLFEPGRAHPFPLPNFIIATRKSKKSHRPVETVTPLAKRLKLPIDEEYRNEDSGSTKGKGMLDLEKALFSERRYHGKTVLICWHHGTLPELAKLLGATDAPTKWHGDTFDRVWQLTYDAKGRVTFADLPQQLLPGDRSK